MRKNSKLNEGLLYIGRFKVGSLPRIINKEKLLTMKKNIYSSQLAMYIVIEQRGWVKAKVLLTKY